MITPNRCRNRQASAAPICCNNIAGQPIQLVPRNCVNRVKLILNSNNCNFKEFFCILLFQLEYVKFFYSYFFVSILWLILFVSIKMFYEFILNVNFLVVFELSLKKFRIENVYFFETGLFTRWTLYKETNTNTKKLSL